MSNDETGQLLSKTDATYYKVVDDKLNRNYSLSECQVTDHRQEGVVQQIRVILVQRRAAKVKMKMKYG